MKEKKAGKARVTSASTEEEKDKMAAEKQEKQEKQENEEKEEKKTNAAVEQKASERKKSSVYNRNSPSQEEKQKKSIGQEEKERKSVGQDERKMRSYSRKGSEEKRIRKGSGKICK